jgi:hypothetical protein
MIIMAFMRGATLTTLPAIKNKIIHDTLLFTEFESTWTMGIEQFKTNRKS